MAVGRGEEPEHDLGLDEGTFVGGGARAGIEHAQNVAAVRAAVRFVFEGRGLADCLAKILLRQPGDPTRLLGAVEAFDNENFAGAELGDFGVRRFESEGGDEARAEPCVFHRVLKVGLQIADEAEREF